MKKLLIIFLLPLLVFSCTNSENSSNETSDTPEMARSSLANAHLNGKVKSIEETPYIPEENGTISEMDSCCVVTIDYDDKGFLMKKTDKNSDGTLDMVEEFERFETGMSKINTKTDEKGKVFSKMVSELDEEGHYKVSMDYDSTGTVYRFHVNETANDFNQPISGKTYQSDSTYMGKWTFKYIDGLNTGFTWVDDNNVQAYNSIAEVNDKGWISKWVVATINEKGDTTTTIDTYTYDSFDETGNWTQRTEKNEGKPVKVLKRSYTYY